MDMYEARQNKEKISRTIDSVNIVRLMVRPVKKGFYKDRLQSLQFTPQRISDPECFKINNTRYWKYLPSNFNAGQIPNINSNHRRYKRIAADSRNEVHATIAGMQDQNIRNLNVNVQLPTTVNRRFVNNWHISVKMNGRNLGGWFNLVNNTRVLGPYHQNVNTHNVTGDEIQQANIILNNMIRYIL